ncbi:hypothetical protein F2Q69_00059279 [Brassica cretica]|uniref:Uncharacterized protein n=1 Tax=Brassica cretica TaxID=69181 RepID=A0A8S9RE32_BRACR|nr:hypothetical protein F2Q69_00059279 [Brassica cretica]
MDYDDISVRKDVRLNFLFINKNEVWKERKNYQKSKDQFVETNKLDHRTRIQLGRSRSANGPAGPNTDSARPLAELDLRRIQLGRSPSWTSPVWRTAELDPTLIQLGERPSWINRGFSSAVRQARPIQFGERPNWTQDGFNSAVRQARPVQFDERPSWIDRNPSSPRPCNSSPEIASHSFLLRLDRRHCGNFTI